MSKSASPISALEAHADGREKIRFSETVLHGKLRFEAGSVIRFVGQPAAAAYFDIGFNGTDFTDDEATRAITADELNFDPEDPSGNETIDPHAKITGREGVADGTTVHQHLTGEDATATAAIEPKDVVDDGTHTE